MKNALFIRNSSLKLMSQALYRKWRPARFDQVIGQEHVTHTLQAGVAAGRVGHAYLFCGCLLYTSPSPRD